MFRTTGLTDAQWLRARRTCAFEAEKAALTAKVGAVAALRWRRFYILCLEAQGATYLGTADEVSRRTR